MSQQPLQRPILVTGAAAGRVGGLGNKITRLLLARGLPVRAMVRQEDARADELRALGAEVVVGDLHQVEDVVRAMAGCSRVYFGFSVSEGYLEATTIAAAVARDLGSTLEVLVNMSQMTVSQMSLKGVTDSPQQLQHWLGEQVLNWSGIPVVHVRPTAFMENFIFLDLAAVSIRADSTLRLPFGSGRTSPIFASHDVAEAVAAILANPAPHIGRVYELTGPASMDMTTLAEEYSRLLGRKITYVDVPFEEWRASLLKLRLPDHVQHHLEVMARLHRDNRYDRMSDDVSKLLGRPPRAFADFLKENARKFADIQEHQA